MEKNIERTIEHRLSGHTLKETHEMFKASKSTIQKWERQYRQIGNLEKKELHRSFRKIDADKLKTYVTEHPDSYQSEMADTDEALYYQPPLKEAETAWPLRRDCYLLPLKGSIVLNVICSPNLSCFS